MPEACVRNRFVNRTDCGQQHLQKDHQMPEVKLVTVPTDHSLDIQYLQALPRDFNACFAKASNPGVLKLNPKADDLKDAKKWMSEKTPPLPATLVLIFDGKSGLKLEIRVGNHKGSLSEWNLDAAERDTKKRRAIFECLGKTYNNLLPANFLKDFDQKNPDPDVLNDLKQKITAKTTEINDLDAKLKKAKDEKAALEKDYKDRGGK
jgi:hypothetical protein